MGASSPGVGELRRPDQSQDFLSPQKANHHPCLRLSNSLAGVPAGRKPAPLQDRSIESLEYKELREASVEYKAAGAGPALQLELAPGRKPGENARQGAGAAGKFAFAERSLPCGEISTQPTRAGRFLVKTVHPPQGKVICLHASAWTPQVPGEPW